MLATLSFPSLRVRLWTVIMLAFNSMPQGLLQPVLAMIQRALGAPTARQADRASPTAQAREYGQDTWS